MDLGPFPSSERWALRAGALLTAVTEGRRFDRRRGLFAARTRLTGRAYAHLWPFACAWSALETASELGGETGARAASLADTLPIGLAAYGPAFEGPVGAGYQSSVTPPLGPGGDTFYDDNAWVALALLERHRHRGDPASLDLAREVVSFCWTGWSSEPAWPVPGGIRWKVTAVNRSRNACSNGPVAEAAALLHLRSGDTSALEWAVRIYAWVRGALRGDDQLYLDRIMSDGSRAPERWTYNQGTMVGAGVLLAQATGDGSYLEEACATAEAALTRYDVGALLRNGPAFNAIFFRNLLLLDAQVGEPRIAALAAAYGDAAWERRSGGRVRSWRPGADALNTVAPLIEIYALLAGASPHP